MGKVRQSYIKDTSERIFNEYPDRVTTNFELNKILVDEISDVSTHKLRNRIAGMLVVIKKKENKILIPPKKDKKPKQKKKRNKRNMGRRKRNKNKRK